MANIMVLGFYEEYRFPQVAKIKRIEIIRGPGSTLWGSEASMGIVNIITKDGNNIDDGSKRAGTFKIDYDHEFSHKQDVVDFTYGKKLGDQSDFLLQANYLNNDAPWTDGRIAGPDGLQQPSWMWFRMNQWDYEPSYEIFLKYRDRAFSVEGARTGITYWQPYLTPFDGSKKGDYYNTRNWLDARFAPQLNDKFKLDTRLFADDYLKGEHQWNIADNSLVYEGTGRAESIGEETVLFYNNASNFNALMGLRLDLTKWRHFPSQSGNERTFAAFAEGTYSGIESLNLTLGGRWERNESGRSSEMFLPRFSAVYCLNPEWVAKYSYNTGYVRFGGVNNQGDDQFFEFQKYWTRGIGNPQKSNSHDLQLNYKADNTSFAITGYKQYVSSIAAFVGDAGPVLDVKDGYNVYYGVVSIAAFETYGAELEFEQKIADRLRIYGNAAWQHGRWDKRYPFGESGKFDIVTDSRISTYDLEPTAVPTYTWNLGINHEFPRKFKTNLHYRGNAVTHVQTRTEPREFETIGAEHYID
ncbi:MAG TPA: TonB-dependent receptor, partial [Nitrosomonas sp.]|nr:TonB-dependent receptor [Nitrosomonas sp.]